MPKAKPTAVPYLTVGFGASGRPQRLKTPPGTPPGSTNPVVSRTVPTGAGLAKPAGVTTTSLPVGAAPAGRPKSNLGNYLIRPTPESNTGFEMLNDKPDVLQQVQKKFLDQKVLPTGLRPTRLGDPRSIGYAKRPQVMETNRAKSISRGWRDPRGRKG